MMRAGQFGGAPDLMTGCGEPLARGLGYQGLGWCLYKKSPRRRRARRSTRKAVALDRRTPCPPRFGIVLKAWATPPARRARRAGRAARPKAKAIAATAPADHSAVAVRGEAQRLEPSSRPAPGAPRCALDLVLRSAVRPESAARIAAIQSRPRGARPFGLGHVDDVWQREPRRRSEATTAAAAGKRARAAPRGR